MMITPTGQPLCENVVRNCIIEAYSARLPGCPDAWLDALSPGVPRGLLPGSQRGRWPIYYVPQRSRWPVHCVRAWSAVHRPHSPAAAPVPRFTKSRRARWRPRPCRRRPKPPCTPLPSRRSQWRCTGQAVGNLTTPATDTVNPALTVSASIAMVNGRSYSTLMSKPPAPTALR
jgi:hypothetical protein